MLITWNHEFWIYEFSKLFPKFPLFSQFFKEFLIEVQIDKKFRCLFLTENTLCSLLKNTYALSFYKSKMILDSPNLLVRFKSFWSVFWTNFYNSNHSKMTWTLPKEIGSVQNDYYFINKINGWGKYMMVITFFL